MIGRTVSHYQITDRLGAGGMGEIYKAQDTRLNRTVAVKVLAAAHADTSDQRRRFLQEAQAASALNHPNIITIHDIVSEGETEFMVMEFVAGKTLIELIPRAGLPLNLVLTYAIQMAGALETAHVTGIVHRDLKPGNVMVTDAGLVKVLDFGLAKLTGLGAATSLTTETRTLGSAPLTTEGSIIGTLSYMSPEQAEGKPVDARSDIFSFGAVLHEMVTGERAFEGDSAVSTLSSILRDNTRPLTETPGVPFALEKIVERCLRKNRDERWQSMAEVRAALVALKHDSESGTVYLPPPAHAVRSRMPRIAAAAGVVVLAGAGGWWWMGRHTTSAPLPPQKPAVVQVAPPPKAADDGALTNDGVLEMVRAHVSPKLIVEQIRASTTRFNLSTSEIIRLTEANVPAEVLEAMRNPKPVGAAPPAPASKTVPAPVRPVPSAATPTVAVADGMPIAIRLTEDVPADAPAGRSLRFTVARQFRAGSTVVLAEGAVVTGEIAEAARKKLIGGKGTTFRLKEVATTGGGKLALRASSQRHGEDSPRPLEITGGPKHPKDLAAVAGTDYVAYVEGNQTVAVKK